MVLILQTITALGTVVAAISIVTAFILYKTQKRDEYLGTVRSALQYLQNGMDELNSLLNYELAYELASSAVFSIETQSCWKNIYIICNSAISESKNKDEVKESIRKSLGFFAISFQTKLVIEYNKIISEIMQKSTVFHPEYQGLYRLSRACSYLMRNVLTSYKAAVTNEKLLSDLIYNQIIEKKLQIESYDDFQKELLDHYISILETIRRKHDQRDIDCLIQIVEMVYNAHILLSSQELHEVALKTKKLQLKNSRDISTITAELREAEKCFRQIMSRDDSMIYASLVRSIEDSNENPN